MPPFIALVGDSDISRWPSELYPSLQIPSNNNSTSSRHGTADDEEETQQKGEATAATVTAAGGIIVSGHSGATLREVIPHVQETLENVLLSTSNYDRKSSGANKASAIRSRKDRRQLEKKKKSDVPLTSASDNESDSHEANDDESTSIFLVICAGENDNGNGISLKDSTQALDELLSTILHHPLLLKADSSHTSSRGEISTKHHHVQVGVVFLGPKLEPWLRHDADARKEYIRMSRSFEACFQRHCNDIASQRPAISSSTRGNYSLALSYVDCLTMFCGDNADKIPGALLGGMAQAQDVYFDRDELHLGNEGYKIWKHVVENRMGDMMSSRFQQA
jgi:hypothetical protein